MNLRGLDDMSKITKALKKQAASAPVNRKTPELALRKARELIKRGCYDVRITTPEGRAYHSSEFGDLPRTPAALGGERRGW
jgi:hypothetical protein